jgi:hypothetical protein
MVMTWGSAPIMQNVGTVKQAVVNNASAFSSTTIFAANTQGDIFEFSKAAGQTKIFDGDGSGASLLAHNGTNLYAALNGRVFSDTSGFYIYRFFGGANPWTPVPVNDSGLQDLIAANQYLYIVYPAGILRMFGLSNSWEQIGGPGKSFACNDHGVFGISGNDHVWQFNSPNNWSEIRTQPTKTIVARGNMLCAIDQQSGHVFQHSQSPNPWADIGTQGRMFAIDDRSRLYGLTPDGGRVFQFNGPGTPWTQIGGAAGQIFAGGSVLCATSPDNSQLWCFRDESQ